MRASLQLSITSFLALIIGASAFAIATGASAAELRSGTYVGELASSTPTSLSPAGGGTVEYPVEPIALSWDAVPGADLYEVEVVPDANGNCDTSSAFTKELVVATSTTSDTGYLPDMVKDTSGKKITSGDYCWHVRAANKDATPGEWSPVARFSVTRTVVPTGLLFYNDTTGSIPRTPADSDYGIGSEFSTNSGYLTWNGVAGATGYDLQVATSATFAEPSIMLTSTGFAATSVALPQLPDDDSYYWRVRAAGGPWSGHAAFQIRRFSTTWLNNTDKRPIQNDVVNDFRVGWNPVPGASYYEVQAGTEASCFWDQESSAPLYWGQSDDFGNGNCRLTSTKDTENTTVNNWATARTLLSPEVRTAVLDNCNDNETTCPASIPGGYPYQAGGYSIYWRVRPVWKTGRQNETLWESDGDRTMYGAWLQDSAAPRPNVFQVDPTLGYNPVNPAQGNRCAVTENPIAGGGCLRMAPGGMSATDAATNSTTLQMPLLTWSAVQGRAPAAGPGSYWVQIAHDPFFNQIEVDEVVKSSTITTPELSFSLTRSLPDDDDGYWWRAIPCTAVGGTEHCRRFYYEGAPGLSSLVGGAYSDGAEPQMFTKRSVTTTAVADLGDPTPMLSIAGVGASTPTDWSRGIQGSEYYQFQVSRTPTFAAVASTTGSSQAGVISSSQPRVQPMFDGGSSGQLKALAGGRWYWRARGVDHNGVAGGWSTTSQFNVNLAAPTVTGGNGAIGAGVVGTWAPVNGAAAYTVEYGTSPNFSGTTTKISTSQLGFRIPAAMLGTVYWRVRAEAPGADLIESGSSASIKSVTSAGAWSAVNSASIVPQTRLRYATSTEITKAGSKVTFQGQLSVSGSNVNGQVVQLQRKTAACEGAGSYVTIAKGRTEGDGTATMSAPVLQNACYRFTHAGATALYSAPFTVKVRPVFKAKVTKRKVNRGAKSCVKIQSNRVVNGTVTFAYQAKGKGSKPATWKNFQETKVRNLKAAKSFCFKIPVAGKVPLLATFADMNHPTGGWSQYELTGVSLGKFVVNNVWVKKKATK